MKILRDCSPSYRQIVANTVCVEHIVRRCGDRAFSYICAQIGIAKRKKGWAAPKDGPASSSFGVDLFVSVVALQNRQDHAVPTR